MEEVLNRLLLIKSIGLQFIFFFKYFKTSNILMVLDLSDIVVIGVSTRVLFNLENENQVYTNQGIEAFRK
jgi:5'-nucleotidase